MFRNILVQIANKYAVTPPRSPSHAISQSDIIGGAINKVILTRLPTQKYSLYINYDETVEEFQNRISLLFLNSMVGPLNPKTISNQPNLKQQKEQTDSQQWFNIVKDVPLIDALILGRIAFCQMNQNNAPQLAYGLQIAEHNLTNRINIPEYIEQGVVELNQQWSNNLTITDAISFDNIRRYSQGPINAQKGQIVSNQLSVIEDETLQTSIVNLVQMKQYDEKSKNMLLTQSSNSLMRKILLLMSTNWIFLFAVTYGKYGWDVGQPLSYLTDLGVDLTAMLGIFKMESQLQKRAQREKQAIEAIMSFDANRKMHLWRVAYLLRKTLNQ